MLSRQQKRLRRHKRIRSKIFGTSKVPRLCIFRSARHIYAQLVDDENGKTLVVASDMKTKQRTKNKEQRTKTKKSKEGEEKTARNGKVAFAYRVGELIAQKAQKKKIEKVVFDRGGYKYHGRVKALAEGARDGGLKF